MKKYKIVNKSEGNISEKRIKSSEIKNLKCDHLCWMDCECAYATKCPKIADRMKKNIAEYDFIKKGYQIYDEEGTLVDFTVNECEKYKYKDPYQDVKQLSLSELKKIRESLKIYYFNAETIDDANKIEYELAERGEIINAHPISKEAYKSLSKKYSKWK